MENNRPETLSRHNDAIKKTLERSEAPNSFIKITKECSQKWTETDTENCLKKNKIKEREYSRYYSMSQDIKMKEYMKECMKEFEVKKENSTVLGVRCKLKTLHCPLLLEKIFLFLSMI